jgi:hypothetical protein
MLSGMGYCWSFAVPKSNLVIVACIAGVISGALFSGVQDGYRYNPFYCDGNAAGWIFGAVTPNRWFVETTLVNELRRLPAQYGFTHNEKRTDLMPGIANKIDKYDWIDSEGSFNGGKATGWYGIYGYGCHDFESAEAHRKHWGSGWYFNLYFLFAYGLMYRFLACFLIVWTDRRKQNKLPLTMALKACVCGSGAHGSRAHIKRNAPVNAEVEMHGAGVAHPVAAANMHERSGYLGTKVVHV